MLLITYQRAVALYTDACGRLPWRTCWERAARIVRAETRS